MRTTLAPKWIHTAYRGRTDFAQDKPLQLIGEVMAQCSGTIVIALERLHIQQGLELRSGDKESNLINCNIPTIWTQIVAAMAYPLGHPLLAIVESGLRPEGFLEEGYDWYIEWLDLDPKSLLAPHFVAAFEKWKQQVDLFDNQYR